METTIEPMQPSRLEKNPNIAPYRTLSPERPDLPPVVTEITHQEASIPGVSGNCNLAAARFALMDTTSHWLATAPGNRFPAASKALTVDALIVGGGITGVAIIYAGICPLIYERDMISNKGDFAGRLPRVSRLAFRCYSASTLMLSASWVSFLSVAPSSSRVCWSIFAPLLSPSRFA